MTAGDRELWAGPRGDGMRPEHVTFLVLAVSVALLAFVYEAIPQWLLPPVLPFSRPEPRERRSEAAAARRGVFQHHLGASGALAAQERTGKRQFRRPGNLDGDRRSLGRGVNMPMRPWQATQGGSDSRPVADAAASGNRRTDTECRSSATGAHNGARGVFASRNRSLRADPTPDRAREIRLHARPDRPPKGQRKNP